MVDSIVYYSQKEGKSLRQKGASSMKKNNMMMDRKHNGYELMGKGMSVNVMRTYWKGSPWKAFQSCIRSV